MSAEEGLAISFDVWNKAFDGKNNRDTAEKEDKDEKSEELWRGEGRVEGRGRKGRPGDHGTEVNEHGGIEEKVDNLGEFSGVCFGGEPW